MATMTSDDDDDGVYAAADDGDNDAKGEDSTIKMTEVLVGNFRENPKRYQNPVSWAWLEWILTPRRYQF